LTLALPDVLGTRIARLVAAEFADPHRLATLGVTRFVRFAANRGLRVRQSAADRVVAAARTALPAREAVVARQVLADDLGLLAELDVQIAAAEAQIAKLLPDTPFAVLLTVPGWGRRYQPGRQCGFAAGADRPRDRVMAQRSGRSPLWPTAAGPRQEGWVIGCAMANCANRIAYALVRDQSGYQSSRQGFPDIAAMLTRLFASAAIELASIKAKLGGPL
jgi:hypothetical protein